MEMKNVDFEDVVDYIFKELITEGVGVRREDIALILDLEVNYLIEIGAAQFVDPDEGVFD